LGDSDVKHRLAAILAADAAGYSRLMAADERATVVALEAARAAFRSQIEANQGRVIDMAGDSVLAVFESAAGAVTAALAVQIALEGASAAEPDERRMRFRIGVHLGDVIEKPDGSVFGDGVNIAARLQAGAEPGGVWVSEAVRGAVKSRIAATFEDRGEQRMKNIAEPVRAYAVRDSTTYATKPASATTELDLSQPDKPSIAVLPFANMSGDPEQEYFTDGVTEDIITELSRFHSLFVIARNSSFTYKGKAVDVRTISKELGVRYVLEGSIRRSVNRVRVTAQLIDALTGNHIWAEKYDRVLEDIFAVQEELTASIVKSIAPRIHESELSKVLRRRPGNLSAYEMAVRARAHLSEAFVRQNQVLREQGISEARAALALDPNCVLALHQLAMGLFQEIFVGTAVNRSESWNEALDAAGRAIELDRSGHEGYAMRGMLMGISSRAGSLDQALDDCRHAHELNPNDFACVHALGFIEQVRGNHAKAIDLHLQSLRINPRDPWAFNVYASLAMTCFLAREYSRGLEWGLRAASMAPLEGITHHDLALCYVGLGMVGPAREALQAARRFAPRFIEAAISGRSVFRRPEDRLKYTTFLRIAAGLEDPSAADALR
jgi:adenylate cyclase